MKVENANVLILNQSYEPLAILPAKKVMLKLFNGRGSFVVEEYSDNYLNSAEDKHKIPSVVRLTYYLPLKKVRLQMHSKKERILLRDSYKCQYCGVNVDSKEFTRDHIYPKSKGGKANFANLVTACKDCNSKKGNKQPEDFSKLKLPSHMLLLDLDKYILMQYYGKKNPKWAKYLFQHEDTNYYDE